MYITPLEVPTRIDRALGEQHPMGNPHFNLDPVSGKAMARAIADGLTRNYPEYGATFKKNLTPILRRSMPSPVGSVRPHRYAV